MKTTFEYQSEKVEKVIVFAKTKSCKTWDQFMNLMLTTHPIYESIKEEYYNDVNSKKAPWEEKEGE